jgi:hypothetical protein
VTIRGEDYFAFREDLWDLFSEALGAIGTDDSAFWAKMQEYRRLKSEAMSAWTMEETVKFFSAAELSTKKIEANDKVEQKARSRPVTGRRALSH